MRAREKEHARGRVAHKTVTVVEQHGYRVDRVSRRRDKAAANVNAYIAQFRLTRENDVTLPRNIGLEKEIVFLFHGLAGFPRYYESFKVDEESDAFINEPAPVRNVVAPGEEKLFRQARHDDNDRRICRNELIDATRVVVVMMRQDEVAYVAYCYTGFRKALLEELPIGLITGIDECVFIAATEEIIGRDAQTKAYKIHCLCNNFS
jgi:hypothetical protein